MTVYLLIDDSDKAEHDRYESLGPALCDAVIRATGLYDPSDGVKMSLIEKHVDGLVEEWNGRSVKIHGPFGKWRVVGRRA